MREMVGKADKNSKNRLIQRICQLSDEKPQFLANFSREDLKNYLKHLEQSIKPSHKQVLVG